MKYTNLHSLREQAKQHWSIRCLQPLFPSMETLFNLDHVRVPYHYGIKSKYSLQTIADESSIFTSGKQVPVHRKTTMLLSPYRWMRGDFGMPAEQNIAKEMYDRLQSPHNAAYVGALAYSVLSESGCKHFPKVYGTFTGTAEKHSLNISDDYEDFCTRPWFVQNIGHFFDLKMKPLHDKPLMHVSEEEVTLDIKDLAIVEEIGQQVNTGVHVEPVDFPEFESEEEEEDDEELESVSTGYVFQVESCDTDGSTSPEDMMGEEEEEEPFAHALFKDVPVQTTVMEACDGTLYTLFRNNKDHVKWHAWVAQVVFALAFAQRNFGLVHNDLHVNNVMYVPTTDEYFYYNHAGQVYRVPTYGYLIKIIDFDRATFSVRLQGMRESRFFMSDQFMLDEEAGGQYNVEPFYNPKYPEIKPNPSFDLVRLATSLFWDCYPVGPYATPGNDAFYELLQQWLTLPNGSSILFKSMEKPFHDRFHGFNLYKAIARFCKDTAVPRKVIQEQMAMYKLDKIPSTEPCLVIDM